MYIGDNINNLITCVIQYQEKFLMNLILDTDKFACFFFFALNDFFDICIQYCKKSPRSSH